MTTTNTTPTPTAEQAQHVIRRLDRAIESKDARRMVAAISYASHWLRELGDPDEAEKFEARTGRILMRWYAETDAEFKTETPSVRDLDLECRLLRSKHENIVRYEAGDHGQGDY